MNAAQTLETAQNHTAVWAADSAMNAASLARAANLAGSPQDAQGFLASAYRYLDLAAGAKASPSLIALVKRAIARADA